MEYGSFPYILELNNEFHIKDYLENIVYLELLRRGYEVYIGKIGTLEVDFIGIKNGITQYFQVSQTILEENTLNRELKPLLSIKD